nr:DBF4-type zinc finger-containing protein 2 homolog [Aegilops tauschii subsp. strangulata]
MLPRRLLPCIVVVPDILPAPHCPIPTIPVSYPSSSPPRAHAFTPWPPSRGPAPLCRFCSHRLAQGRIRRPATRCHLPHRPCRAARIRPLAAHRCCARASALGRAPARRRAPTPDRTPLLPLSRSAAAFDSPRAHASRPLLPRAPHPTALAAAMAAGAKPRALPVARLPAAPYRAGWRSSPGSARRP